MGWCASLSPCAATVFHSTEVLTSLYSESKLKFSFPDVKKKKKFSYFHLGLTMLTYEH